MRFNTGFADIVSTGLATLFANRYSTLVSKTSKSNLRRELPSRGMI
jgi:hypothetical protein